MDDCTQYLDFQQSLFTQEILFILDLWLPIFVIGVLTGLLIMATIYPAIHWLADYLDARSSDRSSRPLLPKRIRRAGRT